MYVCMYVPHEERWLVMVAVSTDGSLCPRGRNCISPACSRLSDVERSIGVRGEPTTRGKRREQQRSVAHHSSPIVEISGALARKEGREVQRVRKREL